jgi:hypothetical protein
MIDTSIFKDGWFTTVYECGRCRTRGWGTISAAPQTLISAHPLAREHECPVCKTLTGGVFVKRVVLRDLDLPPE